LQLALFASNDEKDGKRKMDNGRISRLNNVLVRTNVKTLSVREISSRHTADSDVNTLRINSSSCYEFPSDCLIPFNAMLTSLTFRFIISSSASQVSQLFRLIQFPIASHLSENEAVINRARDW